MTREVDMSRTPCYAKQAVLGYLAARWLTLGDLRDERNRLPLR